MRLRALLAVVSATLLLVATTATATAAIPAPPGGPILVVTGGDHYGDYYAEILRAEGLNEFARADVSQLSADTLASHDVVVLASTGLSSAQVATLDAWVRGGGNLVAMRPDKALAPLLGLSDAGGTLSNGYLRVDTSQPPGKGIVDQTIQYHGDADRYALAGARSVATLYSDATTATASPAVTLRSVGGAGGEAAAFTYDLGRSVIWTRQGNPAWADRSHDADAPDGLHRPNDMFQGLPGETDWLDRTNLAIPQADEQQRLLANLITDMARDRMALPRFWYFPRGDKAEVVMTGDDHGSSGTDTVFDQFRALDPPGCSVADWQCVRATGYVFPGVSLSPPPLSAIDYQQLGFEIALHLAIDGPSCRDFADVPSLEGLLTAQLGQFQANFPGIDAPTTIRTHCIAWSDWDGQPKADLEHGIRLNTDYYWYSFINWDQDRSGVFTGSGMPMRFTAADGSLIDVFQAATYSADDATDSPNTVVPAQMEGLIDRALGPEGYYGAFTVIIHNDAGEAVTEEPARTEVVKYAQSKGVSIISERQLLTWLDGRDSSSFGGLRLDGGRMTFTIAPGAGARGLQAMVPVQGPNGTLQALTRGSAPVQYLTRTIKGVEYALFPALAGDYAATYPAPPPPPPPPGGSGDNGGGGSGAGATGTTGTTGSTGSIGSTGSAAGDEPTSQPKTVPSVEVLSAKTVAPAFPKVRTSARRFRPGSGRSFAITFRLTRAATVTLTIRDAKGKVVRTIRVPKRKAGTVLRLRWDGRDTRGRFVKAGRYRFTIKAATSSKRASTASGSLSVLKAR